MNKKAKRIIWRVLVVVLFLLVMSVLAMIDIYNKMGPNTGVDKPLYIPEDYDDGEYDGSNRYEEIMDFYEEE